MDMKSAVAMLLLCAGLGCAQDTKPTEVKRLSAVTWDLSTHKLVWTVEKGTVVDGEFVPVTKVKYEVSPDEAFMAYAGEKRALGDEEAASLHQLLNVLSVYCAESVVWWEHGQPDAPAQSAPGVVTKPDKITQPKIAPAPDDKIVKVAPR
jgi:hypothetical protein